MVYMVGIRSGNDRLTMVIYVYNYGNYFPYHGRGVGVPR
jgi:hypothetical protein